MKSIKVSALTIFIWSMIFSLTLVYGIKLIRYININIHNYKCRQTTFVLDAYGLPHDGYSNNCGHFFL